MAYVDIDFIKLVSSMPPADIDAVESLYPGTFAAIAESVSRMVDARLHKRYETPFAEPYPEVIRWHVAQVVAAYLWQKRGFNPGSAQDEIIQTNKTDALAWLREAADSKEGLIELPKRAIPHDESAVTKAGPLGYSEASPYTWTDVQAAEAALEQEAGHGR